MHYTICIMLCPLRAAEFLYLLLSNTITAEHRYNFFSEVSIFTSPSKNRVGSAPSYLAGTVARMIYFLSTHVGFYAIY